MANDQGLLEKKKRLVTGAVISDARNKTITVQVERKVKHPIYNKIIKKTSRFHAHDENNMYKKGDIVNIEVSKPLSRTKNWIVIGKVEK